MVGLRNDSEQGLLNDCNTSKSAAYDTVNTTFFKLDLTTSVSPITDPSCCIVYKLSKGHRREAKNTNENNSTKAEAEGQTSEYRLLPFHAQPGVPSAKSKY